MNPQREAALEAQLVQWQERMASGGAFAAGWDEAGAEGRDAKQRVFGELSHGGDKASLACLHSRVW
jgi:hypothetical protein